MNASRTSSAGAGAPPRLGKSPHDPVPLGGLRWRPAAAFLRMLLALVCAVLTVAGGVGVAQADLLGVLSQLQLPKLVRTNQVGTVLYTPGAGTDGTFRMDSVPEVLSYVADTSVWFINPSDGLPGWEAPKLVLSFKVDKDSCTTTHCDLVLPGSSQDFTMSGTVLGPDMQRYTGTLLTGTVTAFGFKNGDLSEKFDATIQITGGLLSVGNVPGWQSGDTIGLYVVLEKSNFTGSFSVEFRAPVTKAEMGAINSVTHVGLLGDRVFEDLDADGEQDCADTNGDGLLGTVDAGNPDTGPECGKGIVNVPVALYRSGPNGVCDGDAPNTDDVFVRNTNTDAAGFYSFANLAAGGYCIKVTKPDICAGDDTGQFSPRNADGVSATANSDVDETSGWTGTIALAENTADRGWDAGVYCNASLGDRMWIDGVNGIPGNAVQGKVGDVYSEPGAAGFTVELYSCDATDQRTNIVDDTKTDDEGFYEFPNLTPGRYAVKFVVPVEAGGLTAPANFGGDDSIDSDADADGDAACTDLSSGEHDLTWDAGIVTPAQDVERAALGDLLFEDVDRDGVQDAEEAGIDGDSYPTLVTVLSNPDGEMDPTCTSGDEVPVEDYPAVIALNADGLYQANDLPGGQHYCVQFALPPEGFCTIGTPAFTLRNQGNDAQDSDVDPQTGRTGNIYLPPGTTDLTWDAGVYCQARIGNRLWDDSANPDGVQGDEAEEPGIPGAPVNLYRCDSQGQPGAQPIDSTTTNASGEYWFEVEPGERYLVEFGRPDGYGNYNFTRQNLGDDTTDSDVNESGSTDCEIVTLSNVEDDTWDAGLYLNKGTLGDTLFHDRNGNGRQDGGEEGVPGGTVELFPNPTAGDCAAIDPNSRLTQVITGSDPLGPGGYYQMVNLPAGNYCLKFTPPAGFCDGFGAVRISPRDQGDNLLDSDIDNTGWTANIELGLNVSDQTWDAGIYCATRLGDRVWIDLDRDGVQDCLDKNMNGIVGDAGDEAPVDQPDECATGVATVPVRLLDPRADGCNSGDEALIDSASTNSAGFYLFDDLEPGNYCVEIDRPDGYECTQVNVGGDDGRDSDMAQVGSGNTCRTLIDTTPASDLIVLESKEDDRTWDAGIVTPAAPSILIKKYTNGVDADLPEQGPTLTPGESVTWKYVVTNTGNVDLIDAEVTDNIEGYVCTIASLPVGATEECEKPGVVGSGDYANLGTVVGKRRDDPTKTVTDDDPSHYNTRRPDIDIRKQIEGPDSRTFAPGSTVTFEIAVTNTGNLDLTNVQVSDPTLPACDRTIGALAAGATVTYNCTTTLGGPATTKTYADNFSVRGFGNNNGSANWNGPWTEYDVGNTGGVSQDPLSGRIVVGSNYKLWLNDRPDTGTQPSAWRSANLAGATSATLSFAWTMHCGVTAEDKIVAEISKDGGSTWRTLKTFTGFKGTDYGPNGKYCYVMNPESFDITADASAQTTVRFRVAENYGGSDDMFKVDDVLITATTVNGGTGFTNEACVSGTGAGTTVGDCDTSTVVVGQETVPGIDIRKQAEGADSRTFAPGSTVTFEIAVRNTGTQRLTNVLVSDPRLPACDRTIGVLEVGGSQTYSCQTTLASSAVSKRFADNLDPRRFDGNDGTSQWAGPWVEYDVRNSGGVSQDPASGRVVVGSNNMIWLNDYTDTGTEPSIRRTADLSGATSATLTFDWKTHCGVDPDDKVVAEISKDGGQTWSLLKAFTGFYGSSHCSSLTGERFDIAAYISATTTIRFRVANNYGGSDETFKVDNVVIEASGAAATGYTNTACVTGQGTSAPVSDCDDSTVVISGGSGGVCTNVVVDGKIDDWDLSRDFYKKLYEAGDSTKAHLANAYTRYADGRLYVLVLATPGNTVDKSAADAWVKVYNLSSSTQVDGNSSNFRWVYDASGKLIGYEASFKLNQGYYSKIEIHLSVNGGDTASTGKRNRSCASITVKPCS